MIRKIIYAILVSMVLNSSFSQNLTLVEDSNDLFFSRNDSNIASILTTKLLSDSTRYITDSILINLNTNKNDFNPNSIQLVNEANLIVFDVLYKPNYTKSDTQLIINAIELIDSALCFDPEYYIAYTQKALLQKKLGMINESIKSLRYILVQRQNYAEGYATMGFIYENLGDKTIADSMYKSSIYAYLNRLSFNNTSQDSVNILVDIAFMLSFLQGKQTAILFLNKLNNKYKSNQAIELMIYTINALNRKKFISAY